MHRLTIALCVVLASPALGADLFVAPGGDDTNPGTDAEPWQTIQHAANTAAPGDVVTVRSGLYIERVAINVSGDETLGWITFRSEFEGAAQIQGPGLAVEGEETYLLRLTDVHHVRIEGFDVSRLSTERANDLVGGILVENTNGSARDIEIVDCTVSDIANTGRGEPNAHGIAVYGRSATPLSNVTIDGCTLTRLTLGASEAMVVNGNVDGFLIQRNLVIDCNNIGIDAIGLEGTAPSDDRARNGVIRENDVIDCSTDGNPYYRGDLSAGGIYVDGGEDILIEANLVTRCDIGIEVASEARGGTTSGVTVRSNFVLSNKITGLACGGYSPKRGTATDVFFTLNTLIDNDTLNSGTGDILVQKANGIAFTDNVIVTTPQNLGVTNPFRSSHTSNITFERNVWWSNGHPGALRFEWNRKEYIGLPAFSAASGGGTGSLLMDPLLPTSGGGGIDTTPFPGSPLIDAGDPAYVVDPDETDVMRRGRIVGAAVDRGAFEAGSGIFPAGDLSLLGTSFVGTEGQPFRARIALRGGNITDVAFDTAELPEGLTFDPVALTITGTPMEPASFSAPTLFSVEDVGVLSTTLTIDIAELSSADRDGDRFPNGLEADVDPAFVSDPMQTPVGVGPVPVLDLTLRKLQVSLRVTPRGFVDKVTLDGTLPFTSEAQYPDQVTVFVGGVLRKFATAGRKKASAEDAKVKLQRKDDVLRVRVTIKPATDFETVTELSDEGFFVTTVPRDARLQFPIGVFVLADTVPAMTDATVDFVASPRKLRAKLARD